MPALGRWIRPGSAAFATNVEQREYPLELSKAQIATALDAIAGLVKSLEAAVGITPLRVGIGHPGDYHSGAGLSKRDRNGTQKSAQHC